MPSDPVAAAERSYRRLIAIVRPRMTDREWSAFQRALEYDADRFARMVGNHVASTYRRPPLQRPLSLRATYRPEVRRSFARVIVILGPHLGEGPHLSERQWYALEEGLFNDLDLLTEMVEHTR